MYRAKYVLDGGDVSLLLPSKAHGAIFLSFLSFFFVEFMLTL